MLLSSISSSVIMGDYLAMSQAELLYLSRKAELRLL